MIMALYHILRASQNHPYGFPDYVLLIQAVMMQESGGRGNDPMQASECGYNIQYPRTPEALRTRSTLFQ